MVAFCFVFVRYTCCARDDMFSRYKYLILNLVFSPPRFLEWESFSDCVFS